MHPFNYAHYHRCMTVYPKKKEPEGSFFDRSRFGFLFYWWVVKDSNLRPIG